MTVHHIHHSQIVERADLVAAYINKLIANGQVDASNLVVLMGENHHWLEHQYFQKNLIHALHATTGVSVLLTEEWKSDQHVCDIAAARASWMRTLHAMFVKESNHACARKVAEYYAYKHDIPVQATDLPYPYDKDDDQWYTDRLPVGFLEKYETNPRLSELFQDNRVALQEDIRHRAISSDGMLRRNLYMMDNIMEQTAKRQGVAASVYGLYHLVDMSDPKEMSLSEMLYANGKDIVNIALLGQEDYDGYQKSRSLQEKRIAKQASNNYFENIGVEIRGDEISDGIDDLMGLYKENKKPVPANLYAISRVHKIMSLFRK